ncbi:MAG TPA: hypothetical protein V6C81_13025 [Planktothrix sp.]|jgi:hypothetical protein
MQTPKPEKAKASSKDEESGFFQKMLSLRSAVPDGETVLVEPPVLPKPPSANNKPSANPAPLGLGIATPPPPFASVSPLSDLPLMLHDYHPRAELIERPPAVFLTPETYKRISLFIHVGKREVGWMGTVTKSEQGDYLIDQVFLLHQNVSDVETEITRDGLAKLGMELQRQYGADTIKHVNRLHFWGHSHVRMGTGPSPRDENTSLRFGWNDDFQLLIRGIFNKRGRAEFAIYRFDKGIRILDVPWGIYDPATKSVLYLRQKEKPFFFANGPAYSQMQPPSTVASAVTASTQKLKTAVVNEVRQSVDSVTAMFDKELTLEQKFAGLPELLRPTQAELQAVQSEYDEKVVEHIVPGFTKVREWVGALKRSIK